LWCKVPAEATGGAYSVLELAMPPGAATPLHVHHREDEILTVVEGECQITDVDGTRLAPAGAVAWLPKDIPHAFGNPGAATLRLIITAIPGGLEKYFEAVNAAVATGQATPEQLNEVARAHQIEFFR
jgi:mannose-6-phosphate isomerase-like protein (cupin superfamily)